VIGGVIDVRSGGTASATTAANGGYVEVLSGGVASATRVNSGGFEIVNGGTAKGDLITNSGREYVSNGGLAVSAVISTGGFEQVGSGGTTSGTLIKSGGVEYVSAGGTALNTTINSGGLLIVSGGVVSGVTFAKGGGIQLADVTWHSGETATLSGGVLTVKNGGTIVATISGFTELTAGALKVTSAKTGHGIVITEGTANATISAHVKVADVRPTGATLVPLASGTVTGFAAAPSLSLVLAKGGAVARRALSPQTTAPMGFLQGMQLSVAATNGLHPTLVAHANVGYSLDSVSARATLPVVGGSQINQHLAVLGTALSQRGAGER
jgi:autotransporter passenger strand-loop-strand repeat protein